MRSGGRGRSHGSRPSRSAAALAVVALVGAVVAGAGAASPSARAQDLAADPFVGVDLPPAIGQAEFGVYVAATGHSVQGAMLDYWRATGASSVYGDPISEPFVADGLYSQAFENGIFQFWALEVYTENPFVRLMPLGRRALADRVDSFRADGRRGGGGGDRRGATWRPLDPAGATVGDAIAGGGRYVEATGHTIQGDVLAWYQRHEGGFYLGDPLSEPLVERGVTVQWFEGGLLAAGDEGVSLLPLGAEFAPRLGIDTTPVEAGGLPPFDETLFWTTDSPIRVGPPDAPGPKRIEVNLTTQQLWAFQGETLILTTPISSGVVPNGTETGSFRVRYKVPVEDMRGATDASGEVVWVVGDGGEPPPGSIPYGVSDVPFVMYINLEAEALHGAYWHYNFGVPMSHGCVNLPMDVAAFLYGWAPIGTPVWVHE